MIQDGIHAFAGKRILLLQGPVGPFFHRLAKDLALAGARVFKVNFNGGDRVFFPTGATNFRGRMEAWPAYFEELLDSLNIDVVLLFGDCRPIHSAAISIVNRRGIELGVFELGYIRPDYVTLERLGVNGHSKLPRNPLFYLNNARRKMDAPMPVGNTYWYSVLWVCLYYLAATALKPMFRHYVHHRPLTVGEVPLWLRSIWRKVYYTWKERGVAARLLKDFSGRFFLIPLQVHNDSQVQVHSDYDSVAHFIRHTVASFAAHASKKTVLVIKHHPMDRAYHDYTVLIRELIAKHSLQKRCFYIHDQHLPSLLKHTCGVVVVNSTVALSALFHKAPVKVCGKAIYNMAGLTFQGPLAQFWRQAHASRPNHLLYQSFVAHLIEHTQLNGSFYKRLQIPMLATGLSWKERSAPSTKGIRSQSGRPTLSLVKKDAS